MKPNVHKKLLKIIIKDINTKETIMELLPTKANEATARNMSAMAGVEVVRVYEN